MKKIIKSLIVFLLIGLLALTSIGCELKRRPKGSGAPIVLDKEAQEKIESINFDADESYSGSIRVKVTSDSSEIDIINALVKGFNKEYPNISVSIDSETQMTSYYGTVTQEFQNNQLADIFWLSQDKLDTVCGLEKNYGDGNWAPTITMPLGYIDQADDSVDFKEDFIEEAYSVSTYRNELYMLPRDYNQVVMFYNKDMLDAAGVAYPGEEAMTAIEFNSFLAKLRKGFQASDQLMPDGRLTYKQYFTQGTGKAPLIDMNVSWDSLCWPIMKSFGGEVADKANSIALDSDANFRTLRYLNSWVKKGYYRNSGDPAAQFKLQTTPILFHSRAVLTKILERVNDKLNPISRLGVAPMPYFGEEYTVGGGSSGYAINRNSKDLTAAWLFMKYIVSFDGQEEFCSTGNGVPVRKDLINDDLASWRYVTTDPKAFPALADAEYPFNNDAFIYGMDWEEDKKPFTSTRDFFHYVSIGVQSEIIIQFSEVFSILDKNPTNNDLKTALKNASATLKTKVEQEPIAVNA